MPGLVYVYTGDGKGKTSAAIGTAVRAALLGKKVVWISFFKGKDWDLAEKHLPERISTLEMHFGGKGFYISKPERKVDGVKLVTVGEENKAIDKVSVEEHKKAATECMELAADKLAGKPFLLVLDEVLNAVAQGLIKEQEVLGLLKKRGKTHVILAGRGVTEGIEDAADLVTECRKVKHPYDKGILAVRGLDF